MSISGRLSRLEVLVPTAAGRLSRLQLSGSTGKGRISRLEISAPDSQTANAGPDLADLEPYRVITLTGSETGSAGASVSKKWRQVSGPTVTITGSTAQTATYKAPGTLAGTEIVFGYTVVAGNGTPSMEDFVTHAILPVTERAARNGVEVPMEIRQVSST